MRCYQCDKVVNWLADDSRCKKCTRKIEPDVPFDSSYISQRKININFVCCSYKRSHSETTTLFLFYPEGIWDGNRYSLEESLLAYPPNEFNWVCARDDDLIPAERW